MQALLSIVIVNAQDFRDINKYISKVNLNDSLLLDKYRSEINANDSLLQNKKLGAKDKCKYLKENNDYKDTVIFVLGKNIEALNNRVGACVEELENNREELKIKDFILCSDTTVFGSKFIELEIDKYPKHIREYYQLIYDLRSADQKLSSIEKIVNEINTNKYIADLNPNSKCAILQEQTNSQILELREQLLKFKERDMSYLSEEQIKFFNEYLKPKYNNFIDVIYNDSINQ